MHLARTGLKVPIDHPVLLTSHRPGLVEREVNVAKFDIDFDFINWKGFRIQETTETVNYDEHAPPIAQFFIYPGERSTFAGRCATTNRHALFSPMEQTRESATRYLESNFVSTSDCQGPTGQPRAK